MIKLSNFTKLAQELIDASSPLLGNRTINIMDLDGIIIASTEKNRIGTLHTGAKLVAETRTDLAITRETLPLYPGAREGCNMPLVCAEEMIGVIGIYGNPSEVLELARLLKVYASKYFEIEASMNRKLLRVELKNRLFQLLVSPEADSDKDKIRSVMELLNINFSYPVRALSISRDSTSRDDGNRSLEILKDKLVSAGFLSPESDLWGFESNSLTILKSFGKGDKKPSLEKLFTVLEKVEFKVKVSAGKKALCLSEIRDSYVQAERMNRYLRGEYNDIEDNDTYLSYMLCETAVGHSDFLGLYMERLKERFSADELDVYLKCLECYYDENKHVSAAAKKLFIHKNTLQYRVKHLLKALGVGELPDFRKEYIVHLLIEKYRMES